MTQAMVLALLIVSKSTLYNLIKAGEFPPPKKIGTHTARWSRAEVDAWIASKLA